MPKNIVIFSDGTGQDGGVRPEQRLSNIYKMYRASRPGPDSSIDPREQVAFYDPGLGTDTSEVGLTSIRRAWSKLLSSVTGRGITTNIADCYEFIINHYRPGDRIWLFGFSRGAYTARCIANVLMLCGVPTKAPEGELPRFRQRIREIAERAVIGVYEHGAGHERAKFEVERDELARRFREEFGSDAGGEANVAPYFIGVFDTVASLGAKGPLRWALGALVLLFVAGAGMATASLAHWVFDLDWERSAVAAGTAIGVLVMWNYLRGALKVMWPPLAGRRLPSMHLAQWSGRNFDRLLSRSVTYARCIADQRQRGATGVAGLIGDLIDLPAKHRILVTIERHEAQNAFVKLRHCIKIAHECLCEDIGHAVLAARRALITHRSAPCIFKWTARALGARPQVAHLHGRLPQNPLAAACADHARYASYDAEWPE